MQYLRFLGWFIASSLFLVVTRSSVELTLEHVMNTLGLGPQVATAGGYSMEVVVTFICVLTVVWRLLWALDTAETIEEVISVVTTRSAIFSIALFFILSLGFANRAFWWYKHIFTDDAYVHVTYIGTANSVFLCIALSWLVFSLFSPPSKVEMRDDSPHTSIMFKPNRGVSMGLGVFGFGLDAWLDEHSAARILLVILLSFLVWEGAKRRREGGEGAMPRLSEATTETTLHIGALLVLMAFSVGFGGVIERAHVMEMVPHDLGGPLPTMALLTIVLVLIGMVMDPYGAVILVSATLAHVAERNGVDALHFWMVVLVAFELGYLTPPVALNHLLTRAVVGDAADDPDVPEGAGFWYQHEKLLLPVSVMASALVLVAFVPLFWG